MDRNQTDETVGWIEIRLTRHRNQTRMDRNQTEETVGWIEIRLRRQQDG